MNLEYMSFDPPAQTERIANIGAEFAGEFLMPQHRGVLDCGDHFLIFGNDGYKQDRRNRLEADMVMEQLKDDAPGFGVNEAESTWAIVVTDYQRAKFDRERLVRKVWDAWKAACTENMNAPSF